MTDIVPVPAGIHSTEFPTNADRTAGTFNPKVVAWGDSTRAQSVRDREIALTAYTNAVAAYEAALASGESEDQAAASALTAFNEANRSYIEANRSEAGAASSWAAAAAAGAAAGLPSMVGKAGMTLTVNAAGNGVEWKAAGFEVGGVYMGAKKPTLGAWLDTDAVYLQSSYPVLFAVLGLVPGVAPWTQRTQAALTTTRGLAYGNGIYVAVGLNGSSASVGATSPDGVTWTALAISATAAITFANGLFVAVGTNNVQTSTNGTTWTTRTIPVGTWTSLTFGGGLFVAAGTSGVIATSPDGITWTARTGAGSGNFASIAYGAGRFVALSQATNGGGATSTDGISWAVMSTPVGITANSIVFANGMFVAVGTGGAITSSDGLTWTPRPMPGVPSGSAGYQAVTYYNGRFIAVGSVIAGNPLCADSPDGVTWTARFMPAGGYIAILAAAGLIVAAGTLMQTAPMFPYNTATQFYVPAPAGVVGLKSWMKAGD